MVKKLERISPQNPRQNKLASPWFIGKLRQNDTHLMIGFQEAGYNKVKLQALNHGRLSLQITTLAEIVDHTGQHLLSEALFIGKTSPTLLNVSKSNYI